MRQGTVSAAVDFGQQHDKIGRMAALTPRLVAYARQQLADGVDAERAIDDLVKHGQVSREEAAAAVAKLAGEVRRQGGRSHVAFMIVGAAIAGVGLLIVGTAFALGYTWKLPWILVVLGIYAIARGYVGGRLRARP